MALLGVNIDHIASVRQLRRGTFPDPAEAALICERAGADSIVAHLREDRRHINEKDLRRIKKTITKKLNLEMSIADEIVDFARCLKPDQATLVPERRQELTTEGGLDVIRFSGRIEKVIRRLEEKKIAVSVFIDPDKKQIRRAFDIGVRRIEIHTGEYANASSAQARGKQLRIIAEAAGFAMENGIHVFAGHGLDYSNIAAIRRIEAIEEYNIGYSIICRALFTGLAGAVRQMKKLVR
jgi:pyridoxine 5-phosphate synthase